LVVTPPYIAINTMQTMASSTNNGSMNPRFYEVLAHQAGIQKKDQQKAGLCTLVALAPTSSMRTPLEAEP
jgi:uncharacterized protein YmfQ (DUF2313 family)